MSAQLVLQNGRIAAAKMTPHLSPERLAAFLDNRLTPTDRTLAMRHFTDCADCRHELTALQGLVRSVPVRRPWRWMGAAAAAALILAVALPRLTTSARSGTSTSELGGIRSGEGTTSISGTTPTDAATISTPFTFTWQSAGGNASYLVIVQDSVGAELYRLATSDTSILLPDSTRLMSGHRYYWSVDALRVDGQSVRTRKQSFQVK